MTRRKPGPTERCNQARERGETGSGELAVGRRGPGGETVTTQARPKAVVDTRRSAG